MTPPPPPRTVPCSLARSTISEKRQRQSVSPQLLCSWPAYGDTTNSTTRIDFSIDGGVKDATRLSTEHNSPMPAIDSAQHHLLTARALHDAQAHTRRTRFPVLDWSTLIVGTRVAAGLDGFDTAEAS
ncbi:hypothetical protein EDB92DRAFT_567165 [Lactarius akahatsu]|uniref:Uncharacterized protein n=1 Tax=Lactarius akahatsu TaxID=416441 RepID=A0AAD4LHV0_9AGAM|nr:hypothetical protein EDB92DRAFT_567165 [Lactarius akahatsu]